MHRWQAHAGSEVLTMLHDPMKNVLVTAGNDNVINVSIADCTPDLLHTLFTARHAT